jgi:hypothetical protein
MANNPELLHWQSSIQNNRAWCAGQGIRYITLIVPERHVVYADKLPYPYAISAARPLIRFLDALEPATRSAVLYPETELLAARQTEEVFYKTDEHLNSHGHYICYLALLDQMQADFPLSPAPRSSMKVQSAHVSGNLGMLLDEEPTEDREFWAPAEDRGVRRAFLSRRGRSRVEIFETPDRSLPRAIIFGDSTLDELRHILAPHFSRIVVVHHCHQFFYDLACSEQPDFVFHIMAEVSLARYHADGAVHSPGSSFLAQCGERLPPGPILLSIDFGGENENSGLTGPGWSDPERTHTWMLGEESILRLPFETSQALVSNDALYTATISLWPMTRPESGRNRQRLSISYGSADAWNPLAGFEISDETDLEFSLPALRYPADENLFLRFEHPDGFCPQLYGQTDDRVLSLAVKRLTISARQGPREHAEPACRERRFNWPQPFWRRRSRQRRSAL